MLFIGESPKKLSEPGVENICLYKLGVGGEKREGKNRRMENNRRSSHRNHQSGTFRLDRKYIGRNIEVNYAIFPSLNQDKSVVELVL